MLRLAPTTQVLKKLFQHSGHLSMPPIVTTLNGYADLHCAFGHSHKPEANECYTGASSTTLYLLRTTVGCGYTWITCCTAPPGFRFLQWANPFVNPCICRLAHRARERQGLAAETLSQARSSHFLRCLLAPAPKPSANPSLCFTLTTNKQPSCSRTLLHNSCLQ
jgi:hypothetical protein